MFWNKKKDILFYLDIINSVIETSHEISSRLYADLVAKFTEFDLPPKEILERNFFLTGLAAALYNDSFGTHDDKLKRALRILSERLYDDAFLQVCEFLKYISNQSLMFDNSEEMMVRYVSNWLYMKICDSEDIIVSEMPPYLFAGSVIYNVFDNFLDKNNLVLK
jgi:hypothetical protein